MDAVSANEGKHSSNEVDGSCSPWPSWMAANADPKSMKEEDVKTPNTEANDKAVEAGSSWWNACSIFEQHSGVIAL